MFIIIFRRICVMDWHGFYVNGQEVSGLVKNGVVFYEKVL